MSKEVDIKDLATEIAAGLTEYDQNVADEIKTIVDDVAQEGVDELKQSSPKLTGSYRRGWRKKQTYADTRTKRNTVFNKTDYQITHLLEYGHASRNGGRVKPSVHIKPVEEKNGNRITGTYRKGGAAVRLETIIDRAKEMGLPLAKDAFRETKENPLPVPPYLVYIVPQVVGRGSDERILLHEIHAALELYTDKVADGSLEKKIEEKVFFDVDYTKYQDTIESEDMVQTAYEFTIYEKERKKG